MPDVRKLEQTEPPWNMADFPLVTGVTHPVSHINSSVATCLQERRGKGCLIAQKMVMSPKF
jgi:hypothetical protein